MPDNSLLINLERSLNQVKRGYRSNHWLDAVRPNPHKKQKWFLSLEDLEVFYGGAAGGGKSDALLMAALQYIDIPGYSAVIFRKTYVDLAKPGAIMDRAKSWLSKTQAVMKDGGKRWEFPGGGTLTFAYLAKDDDKLQHQSTEYQFIGFDELTHFSEEVFSYLFSRLRRPKIDGRESEELIKIKEGLSQVPLRMRSAGNPGGKYGEWVQHNYVPPEYIKSDEEYQFSRVWKIIGECVVCYGKGQIERDQEVVECPSCKGSKQSHRLFVPARLLDNPSIDEVSYRETLARLPATERAQLEHGRWDIMSDGKVFKASWIRRYAWRADHLVLKRVSGEKLIDQSRIWYFMTADTASKVKTQNDPTVICCWAVCEPNLELCLVDIFRDRINIPFILPAIQLMYQKWDAQFVLIEEASSGIAVIQEARMTDRGQGINVQTFSPHSSDKLTRSQKMQFRMESENVFFPDSDEQVLKDCINEMLQFPEGAHDDFVDNLSMAGHIIHGRSLQRRNGESTPREAKSGYTSYSPVNAYSHFRQF